MNIRDLLGEANVKKGKWWNATITAVEGCTHVSPACDLCWAESAANMRQHNLSVARRHEGLLTDGKYNGAIRLMHDDVLKPLHWRKPRVVFWLNDLHHPDVPSNFLDRCYAVMALTPQHVHVVCTKRAKGRYEYLSRVPADDGQIGLNHVMPDIYYHKGASCEAFIRWVEWPLPNVIQMTTCENQPTADWRLPWALKTPAAVRAVAIEPALGTLDLDLFGSMIIDDRELASGGPGYGRPDGKRPNQIGWVIIGGETGKRARPMHPQWARDVRDQCEVAGVPFLLKGWGEWIHACQTGTTDEMFEAMSKLTTGKWLRPPVPTSHVRQAEPIGGSPAMTLYRIGKKAAGRLLDGRTHDKYPKIEVT